MSTPVTSSGEHPPRPLAAVGQSPLDAQAVEAIFRECAADVHAYAISLLGDRAAAEDVTALAFERLYRSRARLDVSRGTPRAWVFSIARNAALDELRRRGRRHHDELDAQHTGERDVRAPGAPGIAGGGDADDALEQVERRATVNAALAALPPREREVVLLKFHGQLTNAELARALGVSESNAGTRLYRALTRLREHCADLDHKEVA
ncbi:MAG TPA: sigma-70 family RNA polymerase sigma factor [Solirubrobacteraceae bacterium]|jgi:RNA polymerase sigma factor (sigma-70 family)|nr:sigma-70 family RNA polymerase sigma factor [Solirubrobacteraceae bacterium]